MREAEGLAADGLRERAARMNPLDSANWIHLATRWEMAGRDEEAESDLLRAFQVDHQFEPRWALASYYFRRGQTKAALAWARSTLEFGSGDLTAVFRLCWEITGSADEILQSAIPKRVAVMTQYVQFLDSEGHLDEAGEVAKILLSLASTEQAPGLLAHCTRLLESGRADAAIAVWNGLVGRGLIPGNFVGGSAGQPSADAGFQREMTGQGFAWGVQRWEGIVVERLSARRGVRIVFSRKEPEHCTILGQWIVLEPNASYRCRIAYVVKGMDPVGLHWEISSTASKAALLSVAFPRGDAKLPTMEAQFRTPAGGKLARLELRYDRAPGTVRPEGSVELHGLMLDEMP